MQPYCNIVTVNVAQQGGLYTLDGTDDRCGAAQSASAVGLAFLNPNGTVGFGLSIVLPGGTPVHVEATINLPSLNGTWRDSAGNSGSFIFTPGTGSGGVPRSVPASGVAPASITSAEIAANAVGPSQIAAGAVGSPQIAPGAVGSAQIAPGAIVSSQIVPGAVGSPQIAANAITGAHVADGSLTTADLADGPRAAFASGDQSVILTAAAAVVRTVTLTAPAAGQVIANASGYFELPPATSDSAQCSLTTGTVIDPTHLIRVQESSTTPAAMIRVPFAGTRGFTVAAPGPFIVNLVCRLDPFTSGTVDLRDSSLTAMFAAQ
jgi:hypothetical protein